MNSPAEITLPQLSTGLVSFAATDPGGWDHLLERARVLDRAGVDRLVVSDHVVFGEDLEAYARVEISGSAGGVQPTGPDGLWLEPLTTLSVLAGLTSRIRLGTNILIAGLRTPAVLAKTAATLDVLSGGRLDLGVGVGWQREEYEASGLDFAARGRLLDRALEVCRLLWTEPRASFESSDLSFEGIHMMPKGARPSGVPIWVAGTVNPRCVSRLGRFGTGWIPWGVDAADPAAGVAKMRAALDEAGHDPTGLQAVGQLRPVKRDDGSVDPAATMAPVASLAAAGVTDFRMPLPNPEGSERSLDAVSEIVAAFRAAVGR